MKTKKHTKAVLLAAVIAVVVLCGAAVVLLPRLGAERAQTQETQETAGGDNGEAAGEPVGEIYYDGAWYVKKPDLETVLFMGVDKFGDDLEQSGYVNSQQADFLLLLVFDRQADTCSALQLNRDTMTEITALGVSGDEAGSVTAQLALAHTYGSGGSDSCINTVKAVSNLLYGIDIDHYASVTMDAVSVINDLAGGVTLTVMDDLTSVDPALVQGEEVTLQGEQALLYVRSRGGLEDSTNLHRMERQRQYMLALWKQVKDCAANDPDFLPNLLLQTSAYIVTDCSNDRLAGLFDEVGQLEVSDILTLDGESVQGDVYMEYYVDEDMTQETVLRLFYDRVEEGSSVQN